MSSGDCWLLTGNSCNHSLSLRVQLSRGDKGDIDMKIGDIQFHANPISYWRNIIRVLYNTSSISNIIISGDKGDIGDRYTLPTPVEALGMGASIVWRVT